MERFKTAFIIALFPLISGLGIFFVHKYQTKMDQGIQYNTVMDLVERWEHEQEDYVRATVDKSLRYPTHTPKEWLMSKSNKLPMLAFCLQNGKGNGYSCSVPSKFFIKREYIDGMVEDIIVYHASTLEESQQLLHENPRLWERTVKAFGGNPYWRAKSMYEVNKPRYERLVKAYRERYKNDDIPIRKCWKNLATEKGWENIDCSGDYEQGLHHRGNQKESNRCSGVIRSTGETVCRYRSCG